MRLAGRPGPIKGPGVPAVRPHGIGGETGNGVATTVALRRIALLTVLALAATVAPLAMPAGALPDGFTDEVVIDGLNQPANNRVLTG